MRNGPVRLVVSILGTTVLLSCASTSPESHYNLAIDYVQQGRLDEAKREYKLAIEANPNLVQARNNLGALYLRQDRLTEAEREFKKVLSINPDHLLARENLASTYEAMSGKDREALETWKAALSLEARADIQSRIAQRVAELEARLSPSLLLPPALTLSSPTPGQVVSTDRIKVEGESSSAVGIDRVAVLVNGESVGEGTRGIGGIAPGKIPAGQPFHFEQEVALRAGENEITVMAYDRQNLSSTRVVKITRLLSPVLTLSSPTPGQAVSEDRVRVEGEVSSPAGIDRVAVLINGEPIGEGTRGIGGISQGEIPTGEPFRFKEEVKLKEGENKITVVAYDRQGLSTSRDIKITRTSAPVARYYEKSWAVAIGINQYEYWPGLEYAVNDANSVAAKFRDLGFDEVIQVMDKQATRERILNLLGTELPKRVGKEDRVVIFFAGHGQTEELANGRQKGYLIPVDGSVTDYFTTAISMEQVREFSERITAKHIYYVMDACYSGLGFTRAMGVNPNLPGYLDKVTRLRSVQMITAGGKGEQVIEKGGHGLFTQYLLRALDGEADMDADGVVTATELGGFLRPRVSMASDNRQTPQYGRLDGEGEVVFLPSAK